MKYRVSILCDNSVGPITGTLGEHGFSALVEWNDDSLLFDTGHGETLLHNARRMGRDLARTDRVVLSHGHHDHTGGLIPLFRESGGKEILAHPAIFSRRYRVKDTGESIPIGISCSEGEIKAAGGILSLDIEFRELAAGIYLTGEIRRVTPFEGGDTGLFSDETGQSPDLVMDDQALVIESERGLVLLLGCCHAGLVNTMEHARERTGVEDIVAVIGGTHLAYAGRQKLDETVRALKDSRVAKICAGHCTGFAASARLLAEFPGRFQPAQVGFTIEI